MKRQRFSEEQIIGILRESEAGVKNQDLCRKHGITQQTFYRWRSKYGWMEVSEAKNLKELKAENRKLKQLLAEAHLDTAVLPPEEVTCLAISDQLKPERMAPSEKRGSHEEDPV